MIDLVIGIDGGGTRTRARLANLHGETLGTGEAGSSNPQTQGFETAQREILAAIDQGFATANLERQIVAAACLGVGGIERGPEREHFTEWARENIAPHVQVLNDSQIVLAAGTPDNWGIALIAGTGAIAWGRDHDGRMARASGWGYLLGDEGSAFDLASQALRSVTRAADGRGDKTELVKAILDFWNLKNPEDLIPRVYQSNWKPGDIARIAPIVLQVAESGDAVAQRLVAEAGFWLAQSVLGVAHELGFGDEMIPLALTGGLVLNSELLRRQLLEHLEGDLHKFSPIKLVYEPSEGAVKLAIEIAKGIGQ